MYKLGDTVYDEINFPGLVGVVDGIIKTIDHPVLVKFKGEKLFEAYTVTGKSHMLAERPTLSHTPMRLYIKGFLKGKTTHLNLLTEYLCQIPGGMSGS